MINRLTQSLNQVCFTYDCWKRLSFLSFSDLEKVIHAFIMVRLDYCYSLYVGVCQTALNRLQLVRNVAARLGTRKREHICPILSSLGWLSIKFRIDFKGVI